MKSVAYDGFISPIHQLLNDLCHLQETQQSLTTKDGQIIGIDGQVIDIKGIAWFGFDDNNTMLDGLWEVRPA